MNNLKVFECRRYKSSRMESWLGALLIAAKDENEAREIYNKDEGDLEEIAVIEGVFAGGQPRILYNDSMR